MSRRGRDRRLVALAGTAVLVVLAVLLIELLPSPQPVSEAIDENAAHAVALQPRATHPPRAPRSPGPLADPSRGLDEIGSAEEQLPPPDPYAEPDQHADLMRQQELVTRFDQAASMLHLRRYEEAMVALHRVLELEPTLPEAHVNMGYALLGLDRPAEAADFFAGAIDLRANQANAYYGMGVALSEMNDLEGGLGAMRSYLHLVDNDTNVGYVEDEDPAGLFIARARSAIWEWEAQLGRGPWGPTRGIPPGFTEEEVRRDGTGVGMHNMQRGDLAPHIVEQQRRSLEALGEGL